MRRIFSVFIILVLSYQMNGQCPNGNLEYGNMTNWLYRVVHIVPL
jgi:hypothetical protein